MTASKPDREPTQAAYVLGAISALVSLISAAPIVMWWDSDGEGFSAKTAIYSVLMVAVAFFAIGAGILRLFGVRIYKDPENNSPTSISDVERRIDG
jgi:hypothetical protein